MYVYNWVCSCLPSIHKENLAVLICRFGINLGRFNKAVMRNVRSNIRLEDPQSKCNALLLPAF